MVRRCNNINHKKVCIMETNFISIFGKIKQMAIIIDDLANATDAEDLERVQKAANDFGSDVNGAIMKFAGRAEKLMGTSRSERARCGDYLAGFLANVGAIVETFSDASINALLDAFFHAFLTEEFDNNADAFEFYLKLKRIFKSDSVSDNNKTAENAGPAAAGEGAEADEINVIQLAEDLIASIKAGDLIKTPEVIMAVNAFEAQDFVAGRHDYNGPIANRLMNVYYDFADKTHYPFVTGQERIDMFEKRLREIAEHGISEIA